jgi:hypothetical protein
LTYNVANREFTVESTDGSLIGQTKPYTIKAELENYPQAGSVQSSGTIEFINPCKIPTTFTTTEQSNPAGDKFTGSQILAQLNQFVITPARCTVSYACSSVVRKDGESTSMSCSDFNFDGIFNNEPTDGKLTITATQDDYINDVYTPGVYVVTIAGTADGSNGPQTKTTTIEITLLDPCDPPTSVTSSVLTNK